MASGEGLWLTLGQLLCWADPYPPENYKKLGKSNFPTKMELLFLNAQLGSMVDNQKKRGVFF